jgi:hypothetical protein
LFLNNLLLLTCIQTECHAVPNDKNLSVNKGCGDVPFFMAQNKVFENE